MSRSRHVTTMTTLMGMSNEEWGLWTGDWVGCCSDGRGCTERDGTLRNH